MEEKDEVVVVVVVVVVEEGVVEAESRGVRWISRRADSSSRGSYAEHPGRNAAPRSHCRCSENHERASMH